MFPIYEQGISALKVQKLLYVMEVGSFKKSFGTIKLMEGVRISHNIDKFMEVLVPATLTIV